MGFIKKLVTILSNLKRKFLVGGKIYAENSNSLRFFNTDRTSFICKI